MQESNLSQVSWDELAEQLTRAHIGLLPDIEPVRISTSGSADNIVTISHAGVAMSRAFFDAEEAHIYAAGLRGELLEQYAALADEFLTVFARQAVAARNE